jgi:hypothetical protein
MLIPKQNSEKMLEFKLLKTVETIFNLSSPEVQLPLNLKLGRRQLKPEKSWNTAKNWIWKILEDNCDWTLQLELPDGYFQFQRTAKYAKKCCKEEFNEAKRGMK